MINLPEGIERDDTRHGVTYYTEADLRDAVADERGRIIDALSSMLHCPCCGESMDCGEDCTFEVDCPAEAATIAGLREALRGPA